MVFFVCAKPVILRHENMFTAQPFQNTRFKKLIAENNKSFFVHNFKPYLLLSVYGEISKNEIEIVNPPNCNLVFKQTVDKTLDLYVKN